jgi:uncharacterized protein YoxC
MVGEQVAELPEPLGEWVEARAAETGRSPEEVLGRAVAAYRLLEEHDDDLASLSAAVTDGAAVDIDGQTAELDERLTALESDVDEKIRDVRRRVVQVKREADEKAPADHDHPELADRVDTVDERVTETADTASEALSETASLREEFDELDEAVEGGFDNYEEILRGLKDATDDVRSRTDRLAAALTRLGDRVAELEAQSNRRTAAAELKREASQKDVTDAVCDTCESTVHLGLLGSGECPHCDTPYEGIDADTGFFRPPRLRTAERPALEGSERREDGTPDHDSPATSEQATDTDPGHVDLQPGTEETAGGSDEGLIDHDMPGEQ